MSLSYGKTPKPSPNPNPNPNRQEMIPVSGRPLNVKTGTSYDVTRAVNFSRVEAAFSALLDSAEKWFPDTLYLELCLGTRNDQQEERPEMIYIAKHGTYTGDGVCISLLAKPFIGAAHLGRDRSSHSGASLGCTSSFAIWLSWSAAPSGD